jgi:hypothetical protein
VWEVMYGCDVVIVVRVTEWDYRTNALPSAIHISP